MLRRNESGDRETIQCDSQRVGNGRQTTVNLGKRIASTKHLTRHLATLCSFLSRTWLLLVTALMIASCAKKDTSVDLVTFPLQGRVTRIDSARGRVTVRHDAIPNYMPAMTMPFKVKDPAILNGIAVGDSVGATLAISRTESWLETMQVLRRGDRLNTLTAEEVELKRLYRAGEEIPDIQLLNQEGRTFRLSDFRGKVLALTFVYTRCPLPDFCIRMSRRFAETQKLLTDDRSMAGRWHLVSISFDPSFDRPPVLKEYGKNYDADFSVWDFGTDPDTTGRDLAAFADGFGLSYAPSEGLIDHNLRTAVLDPKGRLVKVFQGNAWTAAQLAEVMREADYDSGTRGL